MKIRSYSRFWQDIHSQAKEKAQPLRVMFELTYRCNYKCAYCYLSFSHKKGYAARELKSKDIFEILSRLKDSGCFYLGFTGGEPLARSDFLKILERARKSGFEVIVYSNASLINTGLARAFSSLGVNKVDITIPAMTKKVFECITGVAGSHKNVFKAIDLLRRYNVPMGFKTHELKENIAEIAEIKRFASSLKAPHRLSTVLLPKLDSLCWRTEDRGQRTELVCGAGRHQAAITPAGELKMCVIMDEPKYDILKSGFSSCWKRLNVYANACSKCLLEGCRG